MITDIPDATDFEQSGVSFLNQAWSAVIELFILHSEETSVINEISDEFWQIAQSPLANAASLLQLATELLLKARIAQISPYLLLKESERWPKHCDTKDFPFAEFRTVDAQDLAKIYNTVRKPRLDDSFTARVIERRTLRNRIMHTVDRSARIDPKRILVGILDTSHHLVAPKQWIDKRRAHLDEDHISFLYSRDHTEPRLVREFMHLPKLLTRSEVRDYLGMKKDQRWYICPVCRHESGDEDLYPETAQLKPNKPTSNQVWCFICEQATEVRRDKCNSTDCKGNVVAVDDGYCLTCLADQNEYFQ